MNDLLRYLNNDNNTMTSLDAKAQSAFLVLNNIDHILDTYLLKDRGTKGEVLIYVYGLLQSLFVSIDAMYDLAISLTKYKYHLNINQNKNLHELKYIRNDVVGHPTHRSFDNHITGYTLLDYDSLSLNSLTYEIILYSGNKNESRKRTVNLIDVIYSFRAEKEAFLQEILNYLQREKNDSTLTDLAVVLYSETSVENADKLLSYYQEKLINPQANDRLIWRINLVKTALNWNLKTVEEKEIINYIIKYQIQKVITITNDLEGQKIELPYLKLPTLLSKMFKYLNKHPQLVIYTDNLHDLNHPNFESDLNFLVNKTIQNRDVSSLLMMLKNCQTEEQTYLLGSLIKMYRKK